MQTETPQPTVILVRGLPGSGKTFIAHELQKAVGNAIMLDPDATDYDSEAYKAHVAALTAEGVDPALHAYRFLRAQAYQAIAEGKTVIWNQPFTNLEIFKKMTANFYAEAEAHHASLAVLVVEVEVDPAVAKQRVDERKQAGGHGPSDSTFERFTNDYHSFADEGYQTVQVSGADAVETSVAKIIEAIKQLR